MAMDKSNSLQILWPNVVVCFLGHSAALYGAYLFISNTIAWQTSLFAVFLAVCSGLGVTAGAHRLWSHRSYKATLPFQWTLAFFFTMAFQDSIFVWVRNHRVHHKYSDTDADPHNINRGFFFSHIGWLLYRKHQDVTTKGKNVDVSDLLRDPIVQFQKKYYVPLAITCCIVIPTLIPVTFWNESASAAFFTAVTFRYCTVLNQALLINSVGHRFGNRPYDANIPPADNSLQMVATLGAGYHNFHHCFPYDYRSSEYGLKYNLTSVVIDFMAWLGFVYDRKVASEAVIRGRKARTGPSAANVTMELENSNGPN